MLRVQAPLRATWLATGFPVPAVPTKPPRLGQTEAGTNDSRDWRHVETEPCVQGAGECSRGVLLLGKLRQVQKRKSVLYYERKEFIKLMMLMVLFKTQNTSGLQKLYESI